jgi:hypothetical protein
MISSSHGMHAVVTDTRDRRFELLAMPHLDAAFNLAHWLTGNMADAEDVVQDTYRRAFRNLDTFRRDNFRVWLLTLVHPGRSHQGRFGGKRTARRSDRLGIQHSAGIHRQHRARASFMARTLPPAASRARHNAD